MKNIATNAPNQQDNVLIEYPLLKSFIIFHLKNVRIECALIQNRIAGVPVFPIFAAQIEGIDQGVLKFKQVDTKLEFPDIPHKRGLEAEDMVHSMRYIHFIISINCKNT